MSREWGVDYTNSYVATDPFWHGIAEGKLLLQYCPESRRFQHPPRPVSIYTGRPHLEWREVTGLGTVYARTTIGKDEGRTHLVSVDLDEGVRLIGKLLDVGASGAIGDRVRLAWDVRPDGQKYPAFAICE